MPAGDRLQRFADAVVHIDDALDHVALLIGDWELPDVEIDPYLQKLDEISILARQNIDRSSSSMIERAYAIGDVLFSQLQFRGNAADYYDPRNSFLGQVIDRRLGLPITLSVLFLEVARRVGVPAQGVGFPGHFLVRVADNDSWRFIDPFAGGRLLGPRELETLLQQSNGPGATLSPSMLSPVSNRQIVTRMLINLAGIYGRQGDLMLSLIVLERLAVLDPSNPRLARELASLRHRVDHFN